MDLEIIKFMKMMEVRSVNMMRFVKNFTEWYRKENHLHVELSQTPNDHYIYDHRFSIYDDIDIREYDSSGRGYLLLRLVNSNLKKVSSILGDIRRYCILNANDQVKEQILELSKLLGIRDLVENKIMDPTLLHDLLSKASDMMRGPINFFNGAGCYSVSGLNTTSKYMDVLKEDKFALFNENEYKIAESFFEYIERRESDARVSNDGD